jgi:hypothetical protein
MVEDISNKTIVVLVILTVVISVLGTMVVLSEVGNFKPVNQPESMIGGANNVGQVSLEILPAKTASSTGYVSLEIK